MPLETTIHKSAAGPSGRQGSNKKKRKELSPAKARFMHSRYCQIQNALNRHMDDFEGDPFPTFLEALMFERVERRGRPRQA